MSDLIKFYDGKEMNPEVAKEFISMAFEGYKKRKRLGTLYDVGKEIPCLLIYTYYSYIEHPNFIEIYDQFKRRYILNENKLEDVHNKKEREGLSLVYDFLSDFDENNWANIYLILQIHQILYSRVDYPEFGGSFRTENCFISSSDVSTAPYDMISSEISALYNEFEELIKRTSEIQKNKDAKELIKYINDVIILKCKLIKIHPFKDGNGRTFRALVNLMFKQVNLPPVYVQNKEKEEYIKAMDRAVRLGDYGQIQGFYYYKICDSIVELDFNNQISPDLNISEKKI